MALNNARSTIGEQDAAPRFSELLDRVERGEEATITRPGAAVARIVPLRRPTTPDQRRKAIGAMRSLAQGLRLGGLRVKELANKGRE